MHHAQRQGPAASGIDANVIHCFRHIPTFCSCNKTKHTIKSNALVIVQALLISAGGDSADLTLRLHQP
jgi:hypothetical protein